MWKNIVQYLSNIEQYQRHTKLQKDGICIGKKKLLGNEGKELIKYTS